MLEQLIKYKDESTITFVPIESLFIYDSIQYTLSNPIKINNIQEDNKIVEMINQSKIKNIYLFGNHQIYRFILPKLKKNIEVCWVFDESFSNLSNAKIREMLNAIFEYYDRGLIKSIGCVSEDNLKVFENAGYKCEFIKLEINSIESQINNANSIGILSDDSDPNNNFYNQLAALTFVDYDICKFRSIMKETSNFVKYFNIKFKKLDDLNEVMQNNFVNLYINFTNTNNELIRKSYNYGVPVIVGNSCFYSNNKYLNEHLVVKSDDDINEIVDKIKFVQNNYKKILEEYNKNIF